MFIMSRKNKKQMEDEVAHIDMDELKKMNIIVNVS
jgi:hypothetical protein